MTRVDVKCSFSIIQKVQEYMESFNFELAERFCTRAVELSPDNLQALNIAASVYLEVGQIAKAVSVSLFLVHDCKWTGVVQIWL